MRKTDFFTYLFNLILLLGLSVSCVSPTETKKLTGDGDSSATGFGDDVTTEGPGADTFLQEGSQKTTSALILGSNFNDSFYLRGNQVNNYVAIIPSSNSLCLVAYYPSSTTNKLLIIAATKNYFNNYSTGTVEYYLKMYPQDGDLNQNECFTTSLTNALNTTYSSTAFAFKLEDVCPTCTTLISQPINIYNNGGSPVTQVSTNSLRLQISPQSTSSTGGSGGGSNLCSSDSSCTTLDYDCCIDGQCVNDAAVKTGVNAADSGFLSAQNEIISNPIAYQNYPEYYHVCPVRVPSGDEDEEDPDEELARKKRFEKMSELSSCLNPASSTDETAYCTIEYTSPTASIIANGGGLTGFYAETDDLNFSSINPAVATACSAACNEGSENNIFEVDYGGDIVYRECSIPFDTLTVGETNPGLSNDNIVNAQPVFIKKQTTDPDQDYLKIKYRIDGSCKQLNSSFAQCSKFYVQGQSTCPAKASDHTVGDSSFKVPTYANMSFNLIVKVGDEIIPESASTWLRDIPNRQIVFSSTIYANQVVEIIFFVNDNSDPTFVGQVMKSKLAAQVEVNTLCGCAADDECNLKEVTELQSGVDTVVDYVCTFPQPNLPEQPLQVVLFVSSKSVPMRFFDLNGVAYDTIDSNTPLQEGNLFYYEQGNVIKPINNNNSYVGPNEIYGSMNMLTDSADFATVADHQTYVPDSAPKPPVKVDLKKGRLYNIYVDQGGFSSCSQCGVDYYSNLKRLFPETFLEKGGGLIPDPVVSNPNDTLSKYRRDDLLFGRACYVPLTMLPWSHANNSDPQLQRINRQNAQHLYYANGYNRDWYGFDYGSLIASYDGVNWFSVGNRRKTTAKSNKLFFAVNAIMGDLTVANSFKVVVTEVTDFADNPSDVLNDVDSEGAQCQKYHYCSTDSDCITQLGYDYACLNVSNLKSYWPKFDPSGNEIPDQGVLLKMTSLLDGDSNGQTRRCVYRGRGAPCQDNIYGPVDDQSQSYADTTEVGAHACAPNYYCEEIGQAGKFNVTISRFGRDPANQNGQYCLTDDAANDDCTDTVGVSARIAGRPFNYQGNQSIPTAIVAQFQDANLGISGLCIPGKDASVSANFSDLNGTSSTSTDALFGIGPSPTITQADYLYSACPTIDENENYVMFDPTNESTAPTSSGIRNLSASQNILSNILDHPEFSTLEIFKDADGIFDEIGYRRNTCLRAAGAPCFSDYECAPNSLITSETSQILNPTTLNQAEVDFWKEELVCSNKVDKRLPFNIQPNPLYDVKENRCCRELGKEVTIYSADSVAPIFDAQNVAGIGIDIDDDSRYSRLNTVADLINSKASDSGGYSSLISPAADAGASSAGLTIREQYRTFDAMASRTCCTENWVRNFHEDNGGGGHIWSPSKLQGFNKAGLQCLSWLPNSVDDYSTAGTVPYTCSPAFWNTSECEIRNISGSDEDRYLSWLGKFDLLGIPQIMIEVPKSAGTSDQVACLVDGDGTVDQTAPGAGNTPIPNTIDAAAGKDWDDGGIEYYSAGDASNFDLTSSSELKMVFDDKKVTCCLPAGEDVPSNVTAQQCCTGTKSGDKCCLPDFTDVTLYTNRYVSSEANALSETLFDKLTGYLNNKEDVIAVAKLRKLCCSCKVSFGVAVSELFVPGAEVNPDARTRRFLYSDGNVDNNDETGNKSDIFNAKMKWNNHVYCVPDDYPDAISICDDNDNGGGGSGGSI